MTNLLETLPFWISNSVIAAVDIQRFPPPDFESGYTLPLTTTPLPREAWISALDVFVLFAALSLASYLAIKKRSRKGIFGLMMFSMAYFGFYRKGCVCAIGAIQNVSLSLFDRAYAIPLDVAAFFLLPLLFALFFGRVFCSGVCPLGAIQDLMLIRPITMPDWLRQALGMLAYLYLGAAVLFAAMGSAFLICEYDPFIAFFRLAGNRNMVILGISMLVLSLFIGRPYCLFLCPYSVLLRLTSTLSRWRVTISPEICLKCRQCDDVCPFGAITPPTPADMPQPEPVDRRRLVLLLALAPVIVFIGGWIFSLASPSFSRMDHIVRLSERIVLEDSGQVEDTTDAGKAFRDTGQTKEILFQEAQEVRDRFVWGGWILGAFMGLVIVGKLISLSVFPKRNEYQADRAGCVACGRCFIYCPQEHKRLRHLNPSPTVRTEQPVTES